jgi:hypothetical protein
VIEVQSWDVSLFRQPIKSAMCKGINRQKYDGVRALCLEHRIEAVSTVEADVTIFDTIDVFDGWHGSFSVPGADVHYSELTSSLF